MEEAREAPVTARPRRRWLLLLPFAALLAGLLGIEIALRIAGFSFRLHPEKAVFGWPDPITVAAAYAPDPDLFWVSRDYQDKLRRAREDPPAIVFMGDSCTEFGLYHRLLVEQIERDHPGRRVPWLHVGVGGWSSYQGLRQLRRDVIPLRPAVVTAFFGWNDHWIGYGLEDKEVPRISAGLVYRLQELRIIQFGLKAFVRLSGDREHEPVRVSLADFRANLRATVREARAAGIAPVLLTAPSLHEPGREPGHLRDRWLKDPARLIPLHRSYVEAVREVARAEGAPLCDLARLFEALPREEAVHCFQKDGIHLLPHGDARLAQFLHDSLEESGLLERIVR